MSIDEMMDIVIWAYKIYFIIVGCAFLFFGLARLVIAMKEEDEEEKDDENYKGVS